MTTGYAFSYPVLGLDEIRHLWQAAFEQEAPALCFDGLIERYEVRATSDALSGSFADSMSGSAFNSSLELRWKRITADQFKVLILTETQVNFVQLDSLKPIIVQNYLVESGRKSIPEKSIQLQGLNMTAERRIPKPPTDKALSNLSFTYLYYYDKDSQQVKFIRLVATEKAQ